MKINKLLLLSLFVGSIIAHPKELLDHLLYKRIEKGLTGTPFALIFNVLKPSGNELIDKLPEYKLAKIPLPLDQHFHITAARMAKVAAFMWALRLNSFEALRANARKQKDNLTPGQVQNRVLIATGLDVAKDYAVDCVQDVITDNLPESVTKREMHPALKYVAGKAANAALGLAYDQTAGRGIEAILNYFGIKLK